MRKSTFAIYTSYIWIKTLLGLTFHPYKSVRETVRHPIIFPVIFSPCIALLFLFIGAKIGSVLITTYGLKREMVAIFLSTTLISISFWQILLIYFLGSFLLSSWKSKVE